MSRDFQARFTFGKYKGVPRCMRSVYPKGAPWGQDYQCERVARPQDKDENDVVSCSFHLKLDARRIEKRKKSEERDVLRDVREQEAKNTASDLSNRLSALVRPYYRSGSGSVLGVYDPSIMIVDTEFLKRAARALDEGDWA